MYKIIYSDELYHHGIKGQQWGVTNGPPYPLDASDHSSSEKKAGWRSSLSKTTRSVKNVAKYGWKQGHAMNVANRIHENVRTNSKRMNLMTKSQKQSLQNAEKYWNARAKGKDTPKRSIIKRVADDHRSRTVEQRVASNLIRRIKTNVKLSDLFNKEERRKIDVGSLAVNSAMQTATSMLIEELGYKYVFGHY